jgi:NitT/TauT family transport system substrate-binding protein
MIYKFFLLSLSLALTLFFSSCSKKDEMLKISATTWVGYAPLYYAKEKGWLKPLNIKLLHVSSLSENLYLYAAGNADAFVGTQYEYDILIQKDPSLVPLMLFDRSNGGDLVMSNMSIEDLQESEEEIDAYLEMDSVNNTLLKDFLRHYNLKNKCINYIDRDQAQISILSASKSEKPTIVVTYIPYNTQLEKQGFHTIASTKDNLNLLVVDALFTTQKVYQDHQAQFQELKKVVDASVEALEKNPKEFYETIKPYILEIGYEEFIHSLEDIVWINKDIPDTLKKRMKESSYPTRGLL